MARIFAPTSHIDCGDIAGMSYERTDPFTLSIWIRTSQTALTETMFSKNLSTGTLRGWEIIMLNGTITFLFISTWSGNAIQVPTSGSSYNDDVWHHVLVTFDGSSNASGVTIYIDGVDDTGTPIRDTLSATTDGGANVGIGSRGASTVLPWTGDLAEAASWDKELISDEIISLARGSLPSKIQTANLQGYWPVQGALSPEPDLSGFRNNGTLTNTARANHPPVNLQSPRFSFPPTYDELVLFGGSMTTRFLTVFDLLGG